MTIEYQSGEDWIKITDDTKNITADARIKITVNYKNIDAKELLNHNKTLRYHLPELFQDSFVVLNSIQDANGNKIGTIKVEDDTQDVLLSFEESFLQQDEEENKKINGNFSVYVTTDRQLIKGQPQQTIKFGEVTKKLNFEEDSDARLGNLELTKTEPSYSEENGNGYLTYTLIAKTGDDLMPDVVVKDQFTKNQTYIDSYIGVDTTKKTAAHQPNDKNLPYEGNGEQFESKVYLQDSTKPGTLIWEIGDMKAKEIRTLTYKVKLKDLKPKGKKYPLKIFAVLVVRSTDSYIFDPSKYKNNRQQFLNYVKMKANWMQNDKIEILNSQSGNYSVLALGTCSTDQVDDRTVVLAMYKK